MNGPPPQAPSSYTILRIKRKRHEEPLDAIVVEPTKRRKSRGGAGVFQFAETVEEEAWKDARQAAELKTRISNLAKEAIVAPPKPPPPAVAAPAPIASSSSTDPIVAAAPARRYKVVPTPATEAASAATRSTRSSQLPPKVLSSRDIAANSGFTVYDAVLASKEQKIDPEMEKFQSLLQDYLRMDDGPDDRTLSRSSSNRSGFPTSRSDDYVWDVFYHMPIPRPNWSDVSNIATVTGLPPSPDDDDRDSDDDSEIEDEADEDSNAEDFYKNDYPEEEESDTDDRDDSSDDLFDDDDEVDSNDPQDRYDPREWR